MSENSTERTREMYALYDEGATLREVGVRFGLTAERVRQIFAAAGLKTRSLSDTYAVQRGRVAAERGDEIRAAFLRSRDLGEVADGLGVPERVVRDVVRSSFSGQELRKRIQMPPRYSDDELIAFLREAGEASGGTLALGAYKRYAATRRTEDGRRWPTAQTFSTRLGDGSWPKAVRAAGLTAAGAPNPRGKTFTDDECIEALRTVARELDKTPTAREYRMVAEDSGGELPSEATVRTRLGSWYDALAAASL